MIGVFLFHAPRGFHGSRDVEGIDLVENGGRLRRHGEFSEAGGRGKRSGSQKKYEHGTAERWYRKHEASLRSTSLSGSGKVANRNGWSKRICVRRHEKHLLFSADR
jgi:hypothetical protein